MSQTPSRRTERHFHDDWADHLDPSTVLVRETMEAATQPENRFLLRQLGDIRGKALLDIGAGAGETAAYLAGQGALVTALDLSGQMLGVTGKVARHYGATVKLVQASAEELPFRDGSFDIVYAANVLHHVQADRCLREVRRVLKPGGRLASWDPLGYNPLINVYRRLAIKVRTSDEHPLRQGDLRLVGQHFSLVETEFFWFFALIIFMKMFVIDRLSPNKVRYWKHIVQEHQSLASTFHYLDRIDRWVLARIPLLRWFCYNVAVIATKGTGDMATPHRHQPGFRTGSVTCKAGLDR